MSPLRLVVLISCLGFASCGDRDASAVSEAFEAFQRAAVDGDRAALGQLLTEESRPAAAEIDLQQVGGEAKLLVEGERRCSSGRYELSVREAGSTESATFVVVREAGAWRVDLVETMLANHAVRPGAGFSLAPTELDPEQIQGARAVEASGIR